MPATGARSRDRKQRVEDLFFTTLPYDEPLLLASCGHSGFYRLQLEQEQPPFCGLCFFRSGWDAEVPTRIHLFKTLAENGNPETNPKFFAHLYLVAGLVLPKIDADGNPESLYEFRRKRSTPRAREQYTEAAWRLFPVGSALWKLMGYQPPLGIVLVRAVQNGRTEQEIAKELNLSLHNVAIRMVKALRTAAGYLPRGQVNSESFGAIAAGG